MNRQLGRNDPCWCGSGRKYKKCHLERGRQEPVKKSEAVEMSKKAFGKSYCLAPRSLKDECSGKIVKAHTVPKSGSLKVIADNSHVYSFIQSFTRIDRSSGVISPQLVSINKASTFTGFCLTHDDVLFAEVEKQPLVGSLKQCFLLSFRALSWEVFMKNSQYSLMKEMRGFDKGRPLHEQIALQEFISVFSEGVSLSLRDLGYYKEKYDKMLLDENYSDIHSLIIRMKPPPPIMCSSAIFPEQDFKGNQLQELGNPDAIPAIISFTSYYSGDCGIIIFTWLSENDDICRPFVDSLSSQPASVIANGLIRLFFEYTENLYIKPAWWDNLDDTKRKLLIARMSYTINPTNERKKDCLIDDGGEYDRWPIGEIITLGY